MTEHLASRSTQNTFGEFLRNTPPITMRYGPTFHSGRMHPARARSNGSETLSPIRSSVGYTIDMHESDFSEATGRPRESGLNSCSPSYTAKDVSQRRRRAVGLPPRQRSWAAWEA